MSVKNYNQKLKEIEKRRQLKDNIFEDKELNNYSYIQNWEIIEGIRDILDNAQDFYPDYLYSEEDKEEKELEEKYKDAIKWRGPLLKGLVGSVDGFEIRVYSNDHGKHFHVIHRAKGINARFSFPEIKLANYKNSGLTIGNKEIEKIRDFLMTDENFKKTENEFKKASRV